MRPGASETVNDSPGRIAGAANEFRRHELEMSREVRDHRWQVAEGLVRAGKDRVNPRCVESSVQGQRGLEERALRVKQTIRVSVGGDEMDVGVLGR